MDLISNGISVIIGGIITFSVQTYLMKKKLKDDFRQKQLSELYLPLYELINQSSLNELQDINNKARYELAFSIIELITKKEFYASKKLRADIHSLRHYLKVQNFASKEFLNLNGDEQKIYVWNFEEKENEEKLNLIIERICVDIENLQL